MLLVRVGERGGPRETTGRGVVSSAADGSLLITRDGGARLALPAASGCVDAVSFLPDGRAVAADVQRRLRVYDSDGRALADLEVPARLASLQTRGLASSPSPSPLRSSPA